MIGAMPDRPTKISFGEMRDSSVRGLLVYCADYAAATRSQSAVMAGLSDIEPCFIAVRASDRARRVGLDLRPEVFV
jgi:hypothetical protein